MDMLIIGPFANARKLFYNNFKMVFSIIFYKVSLEVLNWAFVWDPSHASFPVVFW